MKKIKLNLKDVVIKDLNGEVYPIEIYKNVGNLLYITGDTIEEKDFGRNVHSGKPFTATKEEVFKLYCLILDSKGYKPWVLEHAQAYLQSLVEDNLQELYDQKKAVERIELEKRQALMEQQANNSTNVN